MLRRGARPAGVLVEFTRLHDLTDSVLATMMRDTATVIALRRARYLAVGRVDTTTWRRTLRREGAFEATVMAGPVMLTPWTRYPGRSSAPR